MTGEVSTGPFIILVHFGLQVLKRSGKTPLTSDHISNISHVSGYNNIDIGK